MAFTKTRTKRVKLYPAGLGRRNLHRWKTQPMTRELMDEIIRVRTRLAEASRPEISLLSDTTTNAVIRRPIARLLRWQ